MAAFVGLFALLAFGTAVFAVILLLVVPIALGGLWLQRSRDARNAAVPIPSARVIRAAAPAGEVADGQVRAA